MAKDPFQVVVDGLLAAGQAAGLGSLDRYVKDGHYKSTIDRTARVAVDALGIEPAGEGLYRLGGLEEQTTR
ncbi:MAG: hypothetical protein ACT4OM_06760 [Actinomycetota bacterium]